MTVEIAAAFIAGGLAGYYVGLVHAAIRFAIRYDFKPRT